MTSIAVRRRPRLLPALVVALVVVAVALLIVLLSSGDDDASPQASACRALGGDLRAASDGGSSGSAGDGGARTDPGSSGSADDGGAPDDRTATCDVPRTAYTVEGVVLGPGGELDTADAARRRRTCATDAQTARTRALTAARTRTVTTYASFRWVAPGLCRSARTRLPAVLARGARADRLLEQAAAATPADPDAGLKLARRADALVGTAASRAAVARAEAAVRRTTAGGGSSTQLVSPSEYLGIGCAQIGHAFRVAPGSDPAHDPDGDGRACEGE